MSNLSIQKAFGVLAPEATTRGGRTDDSGMGRHDPTLDFNETMQRHSPPPRPEAQTRKPEAPPSNKRASEPARDHASTHGKQSTERAPQSSTHEATPKNKTEHAQNSEPSKTPEAAQKSAHPAQDSKAHAANAKGDTDAKAADINTASDQMFAQLAMALTGTDPAVAKVASTQSAVATEGAVPNAGPQAAATPTDIPADADALTTSSAPNAQATRAAAVQLGAQADHSAAQAQTANAKKAAQPELDVNSTQAQAEHAVSEQETAFTNLIGQSREGQDRSSSAKGASAQSSLSLSAALTASGGAAPANGTAPAHAYTVAHAQVKAPVGSFGFSDDFSQRVLMMAGQRVQQAELALTPAELGPISVKMEMRGQEASLIFTATQAATRSAIEDALPRLREMFSASGLHLVDAHVGAQVGQQNAREHHSGHAQGRSQQPLQAATEPLIDTRVENAAAHNPVHSAGLRLVDIRV